MSAVFSLQIVTPERVVFKGNVRSVTCPGSEGRFQVLHNHAAFLSTLAVGDLTLISEDGASHHYAIGGGVSQVLHNSMTLLADTAERADEIDVDRARAAQGRAEQRLATRETAIDIDRARAALFRAINRLKIAKAS
jgi:F-type H+-transporting ATPase subunit epsilon